MVRLCLICLLKAPIIIFLSVKMFSFFPGSRLINLVVKKPKGLIFGAGMIEKKIETMPLLLLQLEQHLLI